MSLRRASSLLLCGVVLRTVVGLADSRSGPLQAASDAADLSLAGGVTVLFEDTFASTAIDPAKWIKVDGATVDTLGIGELSPPYSLRLNGTPSGGDAIESGIVDLSTCAGATLTYYYQQTGAGGSPGEGDDLVVEYHDGARWLELDRRLGSGPDMVAFEPRVLSLPAKALHADFRLRLRSIGTPTALEVGDDWFIENVTIVEVNPGLPEDLVAVSLYPSSEGLAAGTAEAQERQREVVEQLGLPVEVRTRRTGIAFRLIPGGTFMMGSPAGEPGRGNDEGQHEVTLTQPFYCGKFEVTQAQWQQVMGSNPSYFKSAGLNAPVEQVSWNDCQAFLKSLCRVEGVPEGTYRLLTEAEREYACRAGTQTPFCYGGDLDSTMANFNGSSPYGNGAAGPSRGTTVAVGSFRPNGWGLCDMHGNVNEWCQDWYGPYPSGAQTDPPGAASGDRRALRGGHLSSAGNSCRSAERLYWQPTNRAVDLGLRLARTVPSYPGSMIQAVVFEDAFVSTTVDVNNWIVHEDATVDAAGIGEPSAPYSLRLNGHPSGGDRVESRSVDLSIYSQAVLTYSYQRTGDGVAPRENEDLIVEYYDSSFGWVELDRQLGGGADMTAFERQTLYLPTAALRARFKLRLRTTSTQTATTNRKNAWDDWFVDDVKIAGEEPNDTGVEPTGLIPLSEDLLEVSPYASLEGLASGSQEAQEQQRQAVRQLGLPLEVSTRNTGIVFRLIPPGTFTMGSPAGELERGDDEGQHPVRLTQPFYCGKFEVTQAQWQQVMGTNPAYFKAVGPRAPVEQVTWEDCQTFVKRLCQLEDVPEGTYRLPTEAEWEYACRAGTATALCYGNDLDATMANFDGGYPYGGGVQGEYRATTVSVGSFHPNGWGLYDMHGNVYEWCSDWYGSYLLRLQNHPTGPASGNGRVLRGGCWRRLGAYCRSADRGWNAPGGTDNLVGLRLVRTVPTYRPPVTSATAFEDTFPSTVVDATQWTMVLGATVDDAGIGEPSAPYALRLNGYPSVGDTVESKIIDLSAFPQATLTYCYQRTGSGGSPQTSEDLIVEYHDGLRWLQLDRQLGSGPDMTVFEKQTLDLPAEALHAGFRLRIRNESGGTQGRSPNVDDWFVDDVRIVGVEPVDTNGLSEDLAAGNAWYASLTALAAGSEEARERQRQAVRQLGLPLEVETRVTGIALRLIPAGTFTMGSPPSEAGRTSTETQREVTLTESFYCGKFEVTQGQWQQVMGADPASFQEAGSTAPVERVTWNDCQVFLQKLCQLEGVPEGTYRLLTETEWEYACRAGTMTPLCYGSDLDASMANFNGNHPYGSGIKGPHRATTVPVGSFLPNAWGLYDMHGNVYEWCQDALGGNHIIRGGGWSNMAKSCRSASRGMRPSGARESDTGFRLARMIPPLP